MVDLDPRILGGISTNGVLNISRPECTLAWSRDNHVAFITDGGGILIVDFVHTHEEIVHETARFIGNESRIPCITAKDKDLENYTGVSLAAVLRSKQKSEIFDVVRDSILCPKEITNAEVHLYYVKVAWSLCPFKLKPANEGNFQYVLAALDSHFKLRLFLRQPEKIESEGMAEDDEWKTCVDFTESYRNVLINQFWKNVNNDDAEEGVFKEYSKRMYELATVDFVWLPPWDDVPSPYCQLSEGNLVISLITAHASGDICIWNVCVSFEMEQPQFFLTLEFRRNLLPQDIVRSMTFHKLSSSLGLLVIGTTGGQAQAFKVTHEPGGPHSVIVGSDHDEPLPQNYFVDSGCLLCDKDFIEVTNSCAITRRDENAMSEVDDNAIHQLDLFVFKHPNFVLPFKLHVSEAETLVKTVYPATRIVQGTLVGVIPLLEENMLLTLTQRGVLSWKQIMDDGSFQESFVHDLLELENSGKQGKGLHNVKKRLQFGGLIISPNKSMICVSKTLDEYYNHLELRQPSALQFHSLFPSKDAWSFVQTKFLENTFFLHRMADVLAGFRVLMTFSEQHLNEVLDWAVPLHEKSLTDLQLLFWCLRVQPGVNRDQLTLAFNLRREQPRPFLELKFRQIRALRRETLVLDRLMQLRVRGMVELIVANPEKYGLEGNVINLQSLRIMYDYLRTKSRLLEERPLPLKPRVLIDPPPRKPACPLCGKATRLRRAPPERWRKKRDYIVVHELDNETFDGVLWHEQQHIQKSRVHPITNCILSLVPTAYPFRKCIFCGTICMLTPAFGQDPLCPLCNGLMNPFGSFLTDECPEETDDIEDYDEFIQQLKEDQKLSHTFLKPGPPKSGESRRAKIEAILRHT